MLKRKPLLVGLLSAALLISFTSLTRAADEPAKPPTDAPRPRYNPADELKNYRDRFEGVNLTDDQMKKIDTFLETAETEVKTLEGKEDRDSMRAIFAAMRKLRDDIDSILNDTQKAALSKNRQAIFIDSFRKRYTAPELKLSGDQTKKVNAIFDDLKKETAALTPGPDEKENRRKGFELVQAAIEKINAVLTPEQQKLMPSFGPRRPRTGQ